MTPDEQRIAIAKACPLIAEMKEGQWFWRRTYFQPFDPLKDLNACHEFEKTIRHSEWEEQTFNNYLTKLAEVVNTFDTAYLVHATAAQKCEAFLRTVGKWKA